MTLEYLYSDFGHAAREREEKKFFVFLSTATALTSGRQTITDPGTKYLCIKTNPPPPHPFIQQSSSGGGGSFFVSAGRGRPPHSLGCGLKVAPESRCYFSVIVHNSNLNSTRADLLMGAQQTFLSCSQV